MPTDRLVEAYQRAMAAIQALERQREVVSLAEQDAVRQDGRFQEALIWSGFDPEHQDWRWDGSRIVIEDKP